MITEEAYIGMPITSLQRMLRTISFVHRDIPRVFAGGVFDKQTQDAVTAFQRKFKLPVTGVVDQQTWDKIAEVYRQSESALDVPNKFHGRNPRGFSVQEGESDHIVRLVRAMLSSLSEVFADFDELTHSKVHDRDSVDAILFLQDKAGLEQTGIIDKDSWEALVLLYDLHVPD